MPEFLGSDELINLVFVVGHRWCCFQGVIIMFVYFFRWVKLVGLIGGFDWWV